MAASRVRTSQRGWGTLVELCAPEVRNALDAAAVADLTDTFRADGAGPVVIAAEGTVFRAGGDVSTSSLGPLLFHDIVATPSPPTPH